MEWKVGRLWGRLSRRADPTRKRVPIEPGITHEEAEQLIHEMSLEMIRSKLVFPERPEPSPGGPETLKQYAKRWLEDREARKVVEDGRHDRGRLTEHVYDLLGDEPAATISKSQIEDLVLALDAKIAGEQISWKTASNV